MVTPGLKAHFESMGVALIPKDAGARMLVEEALAGGPERTDVVLGGAIPLASRVAPDVETAHEVLVDRVGYPYLVDHAIGGVPVVPVALVLEWFGRAAKARCPHLELVSCSAVKVLKGIRLSRFETGGEVFTVACRQLSNGDGLVLGLELRGRAGRVHYTARAAMAAQTPEPEVGVPSLELEAFTQEVYGGVLFHGPGFQMIQTLDGVSDEGIEAHLVGTGALGWTGQTWCTDAAAVDGGLQLALLWSRHVLGGRSLPTHVSDYRDYRAYEGNGAPGPLRCVLRGRTVGRSKTVSDVIFAHEDGRVAFELRGVETHLLPGT